MPKVFIPTLLRSLTGGQAELDIEGSTVRQVIQNLDTQYPGFAERLIENGKLRLNVAIAIDNDITPLGLMETVEPQSEVHFLTAIRGG